MDLTLRHVKSVFFISLLEQCFSPIDSQPPHVWMRDIVVCLYSFLGLKKIKAQIHALGAWLINKQPVTF